jgi:hypothetical protein
MSSGFRGLLTRVRCGDSPAYARAVKARTLAAAVATALLIAAVALGVWAVPAAIGCAVVTWWRGRAARSRIGGVTGDVLGAIQQCALIVVLLLATAVQTPLAWWRCPRACGSSDTTPPTGATGAAERMDRHPTERGGTAGGASLPPVDRIRGGVPTSSRPTGNRALRLRRGGGSRPTLRELHFGELEGRTWDRCPPDVQEGSSHSMPSWHPKARRRLPWRRGCSIRQLAVGRRRPPLHLGWRHPSSLEASGQRHSYRAGRAGAQRSRCRGSLAPVLQEPPDKKRVHL